MKLVISRSQTETPAGMRFVLSCRLEVSPEETELIKRYAPAYRFGKLGDIWDLIGQGVTLEDKDITDLRDREDKVKKACQGLRAYLEDAQHYQGQEEVEF